MIRFGFFCLLITTGGYFSLAQVVPDIGDKTIIVIDANPEAKPQQPTAESSVKPSKSDYEVKQELTHFVGIDLGYCQLMDSNGGITRDSATGWLSINNNQSLTWRFNILEHKFRIYHDYVGIYTGFALAYNSYGFSNNIDVSVDKKEIGIYATEVNPELRNYTVNKLRTTTLQVPLMLELNTRRNNQKNFHLAAGAIGGWVTSTITKPKWEDDTGKNTARKKDEFHVIPFTIDLSARIGYKKTALFITYGLTPLFNKNQGQRVYPLTFGIQLYQL